MPISASQLYNHLTCPHRDSMDRHASPADRDEPNVFVELLWERGSMFERETIAALKEPFTDLSALSGETRAVVDKQRILDYNEDDCRAMRVLVDGIRMLELRRA